MGQSQQRLAEHRALSDQGLIEANDFAALTRYARDQSPLPEHPDYARADQLLRRVGEELARRWILKEPGPWGRDAPESPSYTWGDPAQEST